MESNFDFKILKDEPLTRREADRFHYSDIADNITDLILKIEPPFTIGIYGKWGVGKSSICKFVQENLEKDKAFETFYFDVWKYRRNSFRRQFLIELDEDVFESNLHYRETLNQSLTIPKTLSLWRNIRIILDDFMLRCLTFSISLFLIFILFKNIIVSFVENNNLQLLLDNIINFGIIGISFNFILNTFKIYQYSALAHRADSSEGFEFFYKEAVKKLNDKKLIVIIDNLDRLNYKESVTVLSDIKTFLANEKVDKEIKNKTIFLIPCDNESVNDHLKKVYGDDFDTEEFLRKFFNMSFKVPKLLNLELDDYILEKLKATNIPEFQNNYSISFVMMSGFRENPREIIQFIDSLIGYYTLVKKRNLAYVVDNLQFLAKILVIRQKWPKFYSFIENKILRTSDNLDEIVDNLNTLVKLERNQDKNGKEEFDNFKEFLKITSSVNVPPKFQDVFFSLHQSVQELKLPEWSSFILAAEEMRFIPLKKAYSEIEKNNQTNVLNNLLRSYIQRNRGKGEKILNVFISINNIIDTDALEKFRIFLSEIFVEITPLLLLKSVNLISFKKIINPFILNLPKSVAKRIAATIIDLLELSAQDPSVVYFEKISEIFEQISQRKVRQVFKDYRERLAEIKNRYINFIDVNLLVESKPNEKLSLIDFLNFVIRTEPDSEDIFVATLKKLQEILLRVELKEDNRLVLEYSLEYLHSIQRSELEKINLGESERLFEAVRSFSNTIKKLYDQSVDWDAKSILCKIVIYLIPILSLVEDENTLSSLIELIYSFISNIENGVGNIKKTINKNKLVDFVNGYQRIKDGIVLRSKKNIDLFVNENLESYFEPREIQDILSSLIQFVPDQFLKFMKYINYKIVDTEKINIVNIMVNKMNEIEDKLLTDWLAVIKRFGIPSSLLDTFYNYLKNIKGKGGEYKKIVEKFVRNNKKLLGESQTVDLLSQKDQ